MTLENQCPAPENAPLAIDLGCPLFLQCKGQKDRFKSRLIGFLPGEYLIIATPNVPGIRNILTAYEGVLVRYIHQGEVFGFRADVIGSITAPFHLTFLACPARVERINLRKAPRIDCHIPATLTAGKQSFSGMILDISIAGCRFSTRSEDCSTFQAALDTSVTLAFLQLGKEDEAVVKGTVKNIHQDGRRLNLGILFSNPEPSFCDRVSAYIEEVSGYL